MYRQINRYSYAHNYVPTYSVSILLTEFNVACMQTKLLAPSCPNHIKVWGTVGLRVLLWFGNEHSCSIMWVEFSWLAEELLASQKKEKKGTLLHVVMILYESYRFVFFSSIHFAACWYLENHRTVRIVETPCVFSHFVLSSVSAPNPSAACPRMRAACCL
jgi:hypothetical protein